MILQIFLTFMAILVPWKTLAIPEQLEESEAGSCKISGSDCAPDYLPYHKAASRSITTYDDENGQTRQLIPNPDIFKPIGKW